VFNSDRDLLPDHEAGFRQLVRQGIFVNFFKEVGAGRNGGGECASNGALGNLIECVSYRRSSAVEILSYLGFLSLRIGAEES